MCQKVNVVAMMLVCHLSPSAITRPLSQFLIFMLFLLHPLGLHNVICPCPPHGLT